MRFAEHLLSNRVFVEKFEDDFLILSNACEVECFHEVDGPTLVVFHTGLILLAVVLEGHERLSLAEIIEVLYLLKCNG